MSDLEEADEGQSHDDQVPGCPVCRKHTDIEAVASQQVIFLGMKAMLELDHQMVLDVFENLSPYDGHIAISLLLMALGDISMMTGVPVEAMVERYRENLTNAQTREAGTTTPPADS